jgi:hypothetical protein
LATPPQGTAHGVVIGTPPAAATALLGPVTFEPAAPTTSVIRFQVNAVRWR